MTRRAWLLGAGIAIAFPLLVHLLLAAYAQWSDAGDPADFAYHDTTFIVYRIGWPGNIALGLAALIVYVLTRGVVRAFRSRFR
ncbi:hypothetical protein [Cohnella sp. GCM10012308]|uniref:hypothetical protein n=1 Tax=Cohnella sp. GCM10012308 TaxID=3317329 RepID=UPI00362401A6